MTAQPRTRPLDEPTTNQSLTLLTAHWGPNPRDWQPPAPHAYADAATPSAWPTSTPAALAHLAQVSGGAPRRTAALTTLAAVIRERVARARGTKKNKDDDDDDDDDPPQHVLPADIRTAAARLSLLNPDATYPRARTTTITPADGFVPQDSEVPRTTSSDARYPVGTRPTRRTRSAVAAGHEAFLLDFDGEEARWEGKALKRKRTEEGGEIDWRWWGRSFDAGYGPEKRKKRCGPMPSPPPLKRSREPGEPGTREWVERVEARRREDRAVLAARVGEGGGESAVAARMRAQDRIIAGLVAENERLRGDGERRALQKRIRELEAELRERDRVEKEREEAARKKAEERERVLKAFEEAEDVVVFDS